MYLKSVILLYSIVGNILYVYNPPGVSISYVCFSKNKTEIFPQCYQPMAATKINKDTPAFMYTINNSTNFSNYFKILYMYPNNTLFNTSWIEMNKSEISNHYSSNAWFVILGITIFLLIVTLITLFLLFRSKI